MRASRQIGTPCIRHLQLPSEIRDDRPQATYNNRNSSGRDGCIPNPGDETGVDLMVKETHPKSIVQLMPRIRPGPVDTNVLLKNIARDVRQWPNPTGMRLLGGSGALRLYAGAHVADEVEERLDSWMQDRGRDPVLGRLIWRKHYLPILLVVNTGTLGTDDPRVQAVLSRHPADAPTAALACVLGVRALSEDRDLVDYGLACGRPWREVIFAAGHVSFGETADFGVALGVSIGTQTVGDVWGRCNRSRLRRAVSE